MHWMGGVRFVEVSGANYPWLCKAGLKHWFEERCSCFCTEVEQGNVSFCHWIPNAHKQVSLWDVWMSWLAVFFHKLSSFFSHQLLLSKRTDSKQEMKTDNQLSVRFFPNYRYESDEISSKQHCKIQVLCEPAFAPLYSILKPGRILGSCWGPWRIGLLTSAKKMFVEFRSPKVSPLIRPRIRPRYAHSGCLTFWMMVTHFKRGYKINARVQRTTAHFRRRWTKINSQAAPLQASSLKLFVPKLTLVVLYTQVPAEEFHESFTKISPQTNKCLVSLPFAHVGDEMNVLPCQSSNIHKICLGQFWCLGLALHTLQKLGLLFSPHSALSEWTVPHGCFRSPSEQSRGNMDHQRLPPRFTKTLFGDTNLSESVHRT